MAREQDIADSLQIHFPSDKTDMRVDGIVIPSRGYNDKNKGYAFITLSWNQKARVNPADICVLYSGRIQANSRFLYLKELHADVENKKHMKAYHARPGNPTGLNGGFYMTA